ncbi:MAG: hypothetical protein ACI4GO_05765 [Hominenteromicrobium sp.]
MKGITVRLDDLTLNKLHYVSNYYERSASSQIVYLVRELIRDFEKEHGEITFENESGQK